MRLPSKIKNSIFKKNDLATEDEEIVKQVHYYKQGYLEDSEFLYLFWLDRIYSKVGNTPGSIMEIGVAYGRNAIIFEKLSRYYGDRLIRKYIGFDTFSGYTDDDLVKDKHLSKQNWKDNSINIVRKRLKIAGALDFCELIEGDASRLSQIYSQENPNLKISILYIDCNAYVPAIESMRNFWKHIVPGGIICVDEKQPQSETQALFDFSEEVGISVTKDSGAFAIPAYIRKPL